MPFVDFKCDCGNREERFFRRPGNFKAICSCGKPMKRVYTAINFDIDFKAGWNVGLGQWVDTKKQRTEIMREKGLRFRD